MRTPEVGIDYIRRDLPGGDSVNRIRSSRPLIEQLWDVDQASQAANRLVHIPEGFAHGQQRVIPGRAVREAIVNGVAHRDWLSPEPTTVEHVGDTLTVTSPGGFIGGITPSNIITHPAVPRYRSLAEAMAALRLGEREGIGVDRMVRDMLAIGRPEPGISEIAGPYVRVSLVGGDPVLTPIKGIPVGQPLAYRLSGTARRRLARRIGHLETPEGRKAQIISWATARRRISSTEAADLTGLSIPYAGTVLTNLEEEGVLRPGRENKLGRGFYYVPAT